MACCRPGINAVTGKEQRQNKGNGQIAQYWLLLLLLLTNGLLSEQCGVFGILGLETKGGERGNRKTPTMVDTHTTYRRHIDTGLLQSHDRSKRNIFLCDRKTEK